MDIITTGSLICLSQTPEGVVTVTNNDLTKIATGVVVTFTTPAGLVYNSPGASQGIFDGTTWQIGSLAPGATATLDACYEVTDECSFPAKITYEVSQGCSDDASNNSGERCFDPTTCKEIKACFEDFIRTDGTLTATWDPATQTYLLSDNPEVDWSLAPSASNSQCYDLVDNLSGDIITAELICDPVFTDNGDGTCTITFANGSSKKLPTGVQSTVVDNGDGTGTVIQNDETTKVFQCGPISIIQGKNQLIVFDGKTSWTISGYGIVDNGDDSITILNPDGTAEVVQLGNTSEIIPILTAGVPIATNDDGNGNIVTIYQASDEFTNNGDGTFTHTDAAGNPVTVDIKDLIADAGCTDVLTDNTDGTYTHTALDGTPVTIGYYFAFETNADGETEIVLYSNEGDEISRENLCNIECPPEFAAPVGTIWTATCGANFFDIFTDDTSCPSGATPVVVVDSISGTNMGGSVGTWGGNAVAAPEDCLLPGSLFIEYHLECNGHASPSVIETINYIPEPQGMIDTDKNYSVSEADNGDQITLTLNVFETGGTDPLTNVVVTDLIDTSIFSIVSATPTVGNWNGTDTWDGFGVVAGGTETIVFVLDVIADDWGAHTNISEARADDLPDGSPNVAYGVDSVSETPDPVANLSITKQVPAGPYTIGDPITYTITVTNYGPDPATNVTTTDIFDSTTLQYTNDAGAGGSVSGSTWTSPVVPSIAANGSVVYTLEFEALAEGNDIVNTAEAVGDEVAAQDTAEVDVTVVPLESDLKITKVVQNLDGSVASSPLTQGEDYQYVITVTNNGPNDDNNVVVTDTLPTEVTEVSNTASVGTYTNPTWTIGALANGVTETLTIVFTATTAGQLIENEATITGDNVDPNLSNNDDTVVVNINPAQSDLAIVKTVDNANPEEGDTITFTLTVTNNGPDDEPNAVIADTLPTGLTLVSGLPVAPFAIANGATQTFDIVATVDAGTGGTTINNEASVSGDNVDPIISNNTSSIDVVVQAIVAQDCNDPSTITDACFCVDCGNADPDLTIRSINFDVKEFDPLTGGTSSPFTAFFEGFDAINPADVSSVVLTPGDGSADVTVTPPSYGPDGQGQYGWVLSHTYASTAATYVGTLTVNLANGDTITFTTEVEFLADGTFVDNVVVGSTGTATGGGKSGYIILDCAQGGFELGLVSLSYPNARVIVNGNNYPSSGADSQGFGFHSFIIDSADLPLGQTTYVFMDLNGDGSATINAPVTLGTCQ